MRRPECVFGRWYDNGAWYMKKQGFLIQSSTGPSIADPSTAVPLTAVRLLAALLIAVLLLTGLGACRAQPEPADFEDRLFFGFAQLGDESEWRSSSTADILRAAEEAGFQLMYENAQQKQANQIKALRSFILNRVDVIAFCPIVEEGWDNVLMEAKDAHIPVILVDRYIKTDEEGLYCAFIGSDFRWQGEQAGEWLLKKFRGHEGPIKIAEIIGTENSSPTIGRYEGFREVIGNNSDFKIVNSVNGDFMRSKGRECMEAILSETPDIDVLYAHNDDMAMGAIEIMEEHGIRPGKDIVIISVDAQKSGLEALKEGKINCLVECSPYVGDQLMDLVVKAAMGEEVPLATFTEEKVYTETDDFDALPIRP